MGRKINGLDWFTNIYKEIEDTCLEMCDVLEKEILKYVEGQLNEVGVDESPEKQHNIKPESSSEDALAKVQEMHHIQTERQTIQSSKKQNHPVMKPEHVPVLQELSGTHKIEKGNGKANTLMISRKQSQKAMGLAEEKVKFTPSIIQNDEFPDWEII